MTDIRKSSFWKNLAEKVVKILLKDLGGGTRSRTRNQHVVPYEDGWAVRGEGNQRVTATYKYQADAIERAKDIAHNYKSSVIIHREDGTIRDRISYK